MTPMKNLTFVVFVCFTGALAGLLFGLDIGSVSGALPFVTKEFAIDADAEGWVVSADAGSRRGRRGRIPPL